MDVLIFNTVPKQSENLIVDFLKKKKKKRCYTPSCPAGPASSISCPLWFWLETHSGIGLTHL